MKERTITIDRDKVFDDIDATTFKFADVSDVQSPVIKNGMQSDAAESLDGHILSRNVDYRDAVIRSRMLFALAPQTSAGANNSLPLNRNIVYSLCVDDDFKDAMLPVLATYIHRYLVYGALYDWYAAGMGSGQSRAYAAELDRLEADVVNTIRQKSFAHRPMQPFGPRHMPR